MAVVSEGHDRGGYSFRVLEGGELLGSAAAASSCAQRLRVLVEQELENGGVALASHTVSSVMNGRVPLAIGDDQQEPLPRVELGRSDHQLNESQWRIVEKGFHDGAQSNCRRGEKP